MAFTATGAGHRFHIRFSYFPMGSSPQFRRKQAQDHASLQRLHNHLGLVGQLLLLWSQAWVWTSPLTLCHNRALRSLEFWHSAQQSPELSTAELDHGWFPVGTEAQLINILCLWDNGILFLNRKLVQSGTRISPCLGLLCTIVCKIITKRCILAIL